MPEPVIRHIHLAAAVRAAADRAHDIGQACLDLATELHNIARELERR